MDQSQHAMMRRESGVKPSFPRAVFFLMRQNNKWWSKQQQEQQQQHSNALWPARCAATPHMPDVIEWERTSLPTVIHDKTRGKWRLSLQYTHNKKKPSQRKLSRLFDTREEAEGCSTWWRLSWEQGHKDRPSQRKLSRLFDTREEAEGCSTWCRLSWEQGHKGTKINPGTLPDSLKHGYCRAPSRCGQIHVDMRLVC